MTTLNSSPGPLVTETGSFYTLIGVVSWGQGCAQVDQNDFGCFLIITILILVIFLFLE